MDGILFDVDGTLWDSTATVAEAWNETIRSLLPSSGVVLTPEDLHELFGQTMREILTALFPSMTLKEQEQFGRELFRHENEMLMEKPGTLYEGVAETVKELSKRIDLYVVSNCQTGYIKILLETYKLTPYFKDDLCYGQTRTSKSETIRTLMNTHHLSEAVYVGDTEGDFDSSRKAGISFIFAAYGFGEVPEATQVIQKFSDLLTMF